MYADEFEDDVEDYAIRPNKSQIKRDIEEITEFVRQLIALPTSQLNQLELDEGLQKAVTTAITTTKGAQKRQIKYIVGLLRKMDTAPIQEKLARLLNKSAHAVREHHIVERWRDNLTAGNEGVLKQLLEEYPEIDRQHLRQLVQNAKKESIEASTPKFSRLLYQYLKKIIAQENIE